MHSPVGSESSMGAFWITEDAKLLLHITNAQADLSRHWGHMSDGTFPNDVAHLELSLRL